jgi:hypothetical protein
MLILLTVSLFSPLAAFLMSEDFMTWMWMHVLSSQNELRTTDGVGLEIISPGIVNPDSGPDIFNARLLMNGVLWAGNVEMHIKASNWFLHGHQYDAAYRNVILHVVTDHDADVLNSSGGKIPVLMMPENLIDTYWSRYNRLTSNLSLIACNDNIKDIPVRVKNEWMKSMLDERLEHMLDRIYELNKGMVTLPSEIFFHLLSKNMGFRVNGIPFSMLAMKTPYTVVLKTASDRLQLEALFFGQSGLLPVSSVDPHVMELIREYRHIRGKFGLHPIDPVTWKFMRMRPNNFPTIRISQFAGLIIRVDRILDHIFQRGGLDELKVLLKVRASPYWDRHFTFNEPAKEGPKILGDASVENIIVNTISVFMFWHGINKGDQGFIDRSLEMLRACPPEKNRFMRLWNRAGVNAANAADSQALYHLTTQYCSQKKCLNCAWGTKILHK